ncbi:rhamnan synthesis F family protein [Fulvimarina sp. 2208YS6-2-32]|uniref:Rhamnan synthesis F family protein n=1 Tax=Fulvimarina uroteuthidis TaxID=3098149 RepID=A0ABU5I1C1_9HYPH|nr:rhamnan synthesis F family protein [Fulvimarina sp. 2208YS6-2-32]MDY8108880.1 rhamnan synthesis F family protein [Fulvimarina sp. 2208YS6-2-32]
MRPGTPSPTAPRDLKARVVVFVHVFHRDVWSEIAAHLAEAMDRPFALVLTCPHPSMDLDVPQTPHLAGWTRITTENRGRDVLPFLTALRGVDQSFEFGLKLHTKRSVHRTDGDAWRRFIANSLLRKDAQGLVALGAMEAVPSIGLVAAQNHLMPLKNRLVLNRTHVRTIMDRTESTVPLAQLAEGTFAAGTMFWFRRDALAPFARDDLASLFGPERAELDGTAAHAAERLFAHVAERRGYLATAEEALAPLWSAGEASLDELRTLGQRQLRPEDNPFILGFRPFWQRHPRLFDLYAALRHATIGIALEKLRTRRTMRRG